MDRTSSSMTLNLTTWPTFSEDVKNKTMYVLDFGPKRDSLSSVIPMTTIYALILITGLVGNVCTCFVIARNRYMHTATNYYLFSLAVSDLLLLVLGLPQEIYQLWYKYPYVWGEAFCVLRGLTSETSTNASILTITSFTMERYLAICHPLRAKTMSKLSRAVRIIVVVWVAGALCAVPLALQFGIVFKYFEGRRLDNTAECTLKSPLPHAFEISTFFFFVLPMTVISGLYVLIGLELRKAPPRSPAPRSLLSRQSTRSLRTLSNSRKAVIKMLFAVVVAFFICWAPFHAQRLVAIYVNNPTPGEVIVYTILTYISGITYYVSATINPILYSIMSMKFRQAFKDTLAHCCSETQHSRSRFTFTSYLDNSIRNEYQFKHSLKAGIQLKSTKELSRTDESEPTNNCEI